MIGSLGYKLYMTSMHFANKASSMLCIQSHSILTISGAPSKNPNWVGQQTSPTILGWYEVANNFQLNGSCICNPTISGVQLIPPVTLQFTHQIAITFEMQLVLFIFVALQLECNTMPQALIEAQGDTRHMSRQNTGIDGSIQCHCIYLQAKMASKFM